MKNVGRNDPCPCGSGKKYKKCHGASNVIEISPERYNAELERLHLGLLAFASDNFHSFLDDIQEEYMDLEEMSEDAEHIYGSILEAWAILHKPVHDNKTIFDLYYMEQQNKMKYERVRRTFATWSETVPSLYVVQTNTEEVFEIEDLRSKETYKIVGAGEHDRDLLEGNYIIGFLLPYIQLYDFFIVIPEMRFINSEALEMFRTWSEDEIINQFPELLAKSLRLSDEFPLDEIEWDNPLYEMVADHFSNHMNQKQAPEPVILAGKLLWRSYSDKVKPSFTKLGSYAAALEYVVQRELLSVAFDTQQELAKQYGVSVTTLSKNAAHIREVVSEEMEELLEGVGIDGLPELPQEMEGIMQDVLSLMEEQEFESEEEAKAFIDNLLEDEEFLGSFLDSPKALAEDKLAEAIEARGSKREKLLNEALDIYPGLSDAYLLKTENTKTRNEKFQLFHQALVVAEPGNGMRVRRRFPV